MALTDELDELTPRARAAWVLLAVERIIRSRVLPSDSVESALEVAWRVTSTVDWDSWERQAGLFLRRASAELSRTDVVLGRVLHLLVSDLTSLVWALSSGGSSQLQNITRELLSTGVTLPSVDTVRQFSRGGAGDGGDRFVRAQVDGMDDFIERLLRDATCDRSHLRRGAIHAIGSLPVAGARATETLVRACDDGDLDVRLVALQGLVHSRGDDPRTNECLLAALRNEQVILRQHAVGLSHDRALALPDSLAFGLSDDADPGVRMFAASKLRDVLGSESEAKLIAMMRGDPNRGVRAAGAAALRARPRTEPIVGAMQEAVAGDEAPTVFWAAFGCLVDNGIRPAIPMPRILSEVGGAFVNLRPPYQDVAQTIGVRALDLIGTAGTRELVDVLSSDEAAIIRARAAVQLGRLRATSATSALGGLTRDADPVLQRAATDALRAIRENEGTG